MAWSIGDSLLVQYGFVGMEGILLQGDDLRQMLSSFKKGKPTF